MSPRVFNLRQLEARFSSNSNEMLTPTHLLSEFTNLAEAQLLRRNQTQLVNNLVMENGSESALPKRLYEKNIQRPNQAKLSDQSKLRK